ncbi:MAG: hypothetical protein KatS3mg091_801 [Patescibacteria group bacterium]|nr:MAG: hypothetical protein KatS3mg091_801 [Patescibacteria group bacterium]
MSKLADKYRKMSLSELDKQEQILRQEIAKLMLMMQSNASEVKNTMEVSNKRKALAVLLTIKRQKAQEQVKN